MIKEQSAFNLSFLSSASGNAVNTFVNNAYPVDIANAMDSPENASRIYLKGGAGSFAEIRLFDEDDITAIKAQNWVINEAHLIFYVDQEALINANLEPPRLYLYNAETNEPLYNSLTENNLEESALGVFLNYDGILEESDANKGVKYTVNITEHLNNIIVRDSVNATLGLQVTADIRLTRANNAMLETGEEKELPVSSILTPLSTVLFGNNVSAGEEANKLQLEIFYTETN